MRRQCETWGQQLIRMVADRIEIHRWTRFDQIGFVVELIVIVAADTTGAGVLGA